MLKWAVGPTLHVFVMSCYTEPDPEKLSFVFKELKVVGLGFRLGGYVTQVPIYKGSHPSQEHAGGF